MVSSSTVLRIGLVLSVFVAVSSAMALSSWAKHLLGESDDFAREVKVVKRGTGINQNKYNELQAKLASIMEAKRKQAGKRTSNAHSGGHGVEDEMSEREHEVKQKSAEKKKARMEKANRRKNDALRKRWERMQRQKRRRFGR